VLRLVTMEGRKLAQKVKPRMERLKKEEKEERE